MPNLIPAVENIKDQMRRGWPAGTDELHRLLPTLFQRIEELENALVPFARVAVHERNTSNELVSVYKRDVVNAWSKLDTKQGVEPPRETFFDMPAEG